jgi:hypothetical protein
VANDDVRKYARLGAEARLEEIAEEARQILAAFPDLHRPDLTTEELPKGRSLEEIIPGDRRRRPRMSAARRKTISQRTRKYRADRRKG